MNGFRNGTALPVTLITSPTIHPEPCRQRTSSLSHQTEQDQLPYTSCQHPLSMHSEHNAGAVIAGSRQTNSPHGQLKEAVHCPTSVRTIPRFPVQASIITDVKCNCSGSPQTNSLTHQVVSSRMPCTPLRVCAPSHASQSGLAPSLMLSATVLVHRKPTRTHTPSGQLKDAVHSPTSVRTIPCLPIRASTIITVLVHCKPTHTHTQWSAQGCRALPY